MFVHSAPNTPMNSSPNLSLNRSNLAVKQEQALEDLTWKEGYLILIFQEWLENARSANIDVDKQYRKMRSVIQSQPDIHHRQQQEVWLLYETTMLNIITTQIIRKIAKTRIKEIAEEARSKPELQHLVGLITDCENFLLRKLPVKLPQMAPVETAIEQYWGIHHELVNMTEKILSKAKV